MAEYKGCSHLGRGERALLLWDGVLAVGHPLDQLRWVLLLEQLVLVPSRR